MAVADFQEDANQERHSRRPMLLPIILILLVLVVGGGGYLAFRFVPSVREAVLKLPVVGPMLGGAATSVDPLRAEQLQLEQDRTALQALQTQLTDLQSQLTAKETELAAREAAAQQLMTDAAALKAESEGKLATIDQQVKLYSAMKPDKAAAVMSELADAAVARVLVKMDSSAAARILSCMQAARAARVISLMGS